MGTEKRQYTLNKSKEGLEIDLKAEVVCVTVVPKSPNIASVSVEIAGEAKATVKAWNKNLARCGGDVYVNQTFQEDKKDEIT